MLNLKFGGSGTKIIEERIRITHEMPEISVEADSLEEGYEIARFKYHDIGYMIVHSLRCIDGKKFKKD